MKKLAQQKLDSMSSSSNSDNDLPVDPKDMAEAKDIIGHDVSVILGGGDAFGNRKQGLVDKIERRIRNNPAVARAMLMYIKEEQQKTGKTVFTPRHGIWSNLPTLNKRAEEARNQGVSETEHGVSGALFTGSDGTEIVENKDIGRYQIKFPGKPDATVRNYLKRNGFHWSPSNGTWQTQNTANGERRMKDVAEYLKLNKTE